MSVYEFNSFSVSSTYLMPYLTPLSLIVKKCPKNNSVFFTDFDIGRKIHVDINRNDFILDYTDAMYWHLRKIWGHTTKIIFFQCVYWETNWSGLFCSLKPIIYWLDTCEMILKAVARSRRTKQHEAGFSSQCFKGFSHLVEV